MSEHPVDERQRAAYRAFVRENHPDRGGDPEVFVAGLARFHTLREASEDDRHDRPVEVVVTPPLPVRVGVALIRTWHRRRRRRVQ